MPELPAILAGPFAHWFGRACAVTRVEDLTPPFRRVGFAGRALRGRAWAAGQEIEFRVGESAFRHYTPARYDSGIGEIDVICYQHAEGGLGRTWVSQLAVGQPVSVLGPGGTFSVASDDQWSMFLGDETTVSLFVALAHAVSPGVPILGAVEVGEDEAVSALDGLVPGLEIVPRAGAPQGERLVEWVHHATVPTGPGTAYVVGYGQSIQRLRAVLLGEQHLDRRRIKSKAFWADGKCGL